jgi:hypothetical protein
MPAGKRPGPSVVVVKSGSEGAVAAVLKAVTPIPVASCYSPARLHTGMTSAKYRIYVRLKNGDQVGGREIYKGPRPASGTELEVPLLRGGTVKARIGSSHTNERDGFAGTLVTEIIYADEI